MQRYGSNINMQHQQQQHKMDKENMVYIKSGTILCHEKEWNVSICNNIDGLEDYYAKWNKLEKDKHCIPLICGI